ncbi:MAG: UvrD-helicase domain-containing protein, partial [Candidatus Hydrothermarchaeota archaeon]
MASSIICDFHTENQNKAIEHFKGPLLIIAGPGTGKTRVITHRVAYLIKEKGIKPENILVTTFTNKAADQLKDRIEKLIGEDVES